jgi:cyanophycinase
MHGIKGVGTFLVRRGVDEVKPWKKVIPLLILCLALFPWVDGGPLPAQAVSPSKVFLMGGSINDNQADIFEGLKAATGKTTPVVAVICSGSASFEDAYDAYHNDARGSLSYQNLFAKYGFQPVFVPVAVDNYQTEAYSQTNIQRVQQADVIFFNGGNQARHARSLLKDDGSDTPLMSAIRQRFQNGAVMAGTSAGAAIQGTFTYGEGDSYGYLEANGLVRKSIRDLSLEDPNNRYNGGYMTGFHFIDAAVDTHFDARGRIGRLFVAQRDLGHAFGVGVDENTAFYVNGSLGRVYGQRGVFIADAGDTSYGNGRYFSASNLRLSYLTSGDTYHFGNRSVYSAKASITRPRYKQIRDSSDIFGPYETTTTLTRVVDTQNVSVLYGDSYDRNPTFTLRFSQTDRTRGYVINGQYTVDQARVDVTYR